MRGKPWIRKHRTKWIPAFPERNQETRRTYHAGMSWIRNRQQTEISVDSDWQTQSRTIISSSGDKITISLTENLSILRGLGGHPKAIFITFQKMENDKNSHLLYKCTACQFTNSHNFPAGLGSVPNKISRQENVTNRFLYYTGVSCSYNLPPLFFWHK